MSKRKLSRRGFLAASAGAAGAAVTPLAAQVPVVNSAPEQNLILINGRIHTMDARNTIASTVTIRNGRFVAVSDARPARQTGARVIDLKGRTVVPGLVEAHIHSVSLGNRPGYHTILENTTSIREIQESLAARRKDVPEGQWITSMGGWHPNQWAEHRHPTRRELDEAVPDRPVLLYERFTGPCATNTPGKAFFDAADAAPPVHPAVVKVNVSETGMIAAAIQMGGGSSASALFHLRWLQTFKQRPQTTFLVHGEPDAASQLQQTLASKLGWNIKVAQWLEKVELA